MKEVASHGHSEQPRKPLSEKIKTALTPRFLRPLPEELQAIEKTVWSGQHPLIGEDLTHVVVEEYMGSRKQEPYLRVRDLRPPFEQSFLTKKDPETGQVELRLEGHYPLDPKEQI